MPSFSKLNGYDVKDVSARNDISVLSQELVNINLDIDAHDNILNEHTQTINTHETDISRLNTKDSQLQSQINSLSSGSPAGVYDTLADLISDDPDHSKIYIVTDNGYWYYYNNDEWVQGGVYQSTNGSEINNSLEELNQNIENLTSKVFSLGFLEKDLSGIDTTFITETNSNTNDIAGYVGIKLAPLTTMDSYWLVFDSDQYVYLDDNANYLAICIANDFTGTTTDSTSTYLLGSNPVRYRKSESNLPTEINPLLIPGGSVVAITITKGVLPKLYVKGYTNILNNNIILNNSQINQIIDKTCKVKYRTNTPTNDNDYSTENLDIYLPTYNGYIKYDFQHCVLDSINADSWRIKDATKSSVNLIDSTKITTKGEWECAIHLNNRNDFSGGILHGDEIVNNIKFIIDGSVTNPQTLTSAVNFKELKIIENTTLYDPNDNTTQIAIHGKEYIFTKDGLILNQSLKWLVAEDLTDCYMAMFPVNKSVTNSIYTDVDFECDSIDYGYIQDCESATVYSESANFIATIDIPKYVSFTGGNSLYITDNNGNNYNKLYYIVCKSPSLANPISHTTTVNELWKTTTKYKLDITN